MFGGILRCNRWGDWCGFSAGSIDEMGDGGKQRCQCRQERAGGDHSRTVPPGGHVGKQDGRGELAHVVGRDDQPKLNTTKVEPLLQRGQHAVKVGGVGHVADEDQTETYSKGFDVRSSRARLTLR